MTEPGFIKMPERSNWRVEICGVHYHPVKGQEPNAFHRWMQRLAFGFRWKKTKGEQEG